MCAIRLFTHLPIGHKICTEYAFWKAFNIMCILCGHLDLQGHFALFSLTFHIFAAFMCRRFLAQVRQIFTECAPLPPLHKGHPDLDLFAAVQLEFSNTCNAYTLNPFLVFRYPMYTKLSLHIYGSHEIPKTAARFSLFSSIKRVIIWEWQI